MSSARRKEGGWADSLVRHGSAARKINYFFINWHTVVAVVVELQRAHAYNCLLPAKKGRCVRENIRKVQSDNERLVEAVSNEAGCEGAKDIEHKATSQSRGIFFHQSRAFECLSCRLAANALHRRD